MKEKTACLIVLGLFGIFVLWILSLFFGSWNIPANGEHTGIVTAAQKSGIFFKTYRISFKTGNNTGQQYEYCVTDENLFNQLTQLSNKGASVTVDYYAPLYVGYWHCGNEDGIVTNVKAETK